MAKEQLAGTRVKSPRRIQDLILWEVEQRFCRTSVSVAGPVTLEIGTVLVDKTVSASASPGLQASFSDSLCLRNVEIADGETLEIPVLARGPAVCDLDAVVRTTDESDADLKTRLADLRAQGVRFTREPANTNATKLADIA